jgi:hypothetical protein
MSTMALVEGPNGVVAAWETDGQIYFATIRPGTVEFTPPQSAPGPGRARKHPALATNSRGETVLAWTEGTGWNKGGALAWQVFGRDGQPAAAEERKEGGIAVWGLPTVVATEEGFTLVH